MYEVKLRASNAGVKPEEIQKNIDSILMDVDQSVSGYNPQSVLSRFNRGEAVVPDTIFSELYRRSREIWELTEGAVDVAAGPIFDIWGFGFTADSLPPASLIEETLKNCGMALLPEDPALLGKAIDNHECPQPRLNFNCIAQGFSCDLIASYLHGLGIHDIMINVGGEIFIEGKNPAGENWKVGIDKPVDGNAIAGEDIQGVYEAGGEACGLVTSGNYRKFYIRDGRKYSHTIDPRNGYPVSHSLLCATVVAPDATTADALATYCMVIGLEEASRFILADDRLEACLLYDEDGKIKAWTSPGFIFTEM